MISMEFLLTSLIVVLIPGTGVIYTISAGLFQGRKASIAASFGCTLGIIPALLACVLGLSAILHTSALAFQVVKYIGVAYLLYLAWGMWRSSSEGEMTFAKSNEVSFKKIAIQGCLINILNPKLSLFFLAFLPQFVPADSSSTLGSMLILGSVFMLMTFIVFIGYGLLANTVSQYVTQSKRAISYLQKTFAASFAGLGAKLALSDN
ncbi:Putative threonine efflux protein [Vibrio nigripulchritudo MADA3029]|uniref:LysE family translocator n=1 Tax=Vibrio nigripulchritudo TaxID=28173 RepID=UPI00021C3BBC|nr:LysE family translocator [Vibrio nigripulchritudo]EGU54994.1 lysine exporter protein LysE/YggA [Vibrio nigripulchritudo ATCC 27043]CCN46651.1 Putative threonine efflux protein [Vibrio nigripulchritudo MADA3020]CCN54572.1 Putative threonine efflux protein [Vibrio nigripulchritudo MADA3021]CCN59510.1 Putative threonine efflux protein [Vibrio nigripulchritudo MADA3029]